MGKNTMWGKRLGLTFALALAGCGDRDATPTLGPVQVTSIEDNLVFIDQGRGAALLVDVSGTKAPAAPKVVPLLPSPGHYERRLGHDDQLLVLAQGHQDDGDAPFAQPGLVVLGKDGKTESFRYDSAFDQISQSDDGAYAIVSFSPNASAAASSLLFNPNEIAVLNLETGDAPAVRTLRSFGGSPNSIAFSPEMTVGSSAPRRLAVVLFDAVLSIIDLSHLERAEYTVELSHRGVGSLELAQVLFSQTEPKLYLRAQGSNDVYVISLSETAPDATHENDFVPVLNQLGAGTAPSDLALFDEAGSPRLLVAAPGSTSAVVVEPNGSTVTDVPLPRAANRILRFQGPAPFDDKSAERALLYGGDATSVTFLDLADIEERVTRNVELLTVSEPFTTAEQIDDETVMLVHQTTGLSLLDLAGRTVAEIAGPNLQGAVRDPNVRKLWLQPLGQPRLGYLDLDQGFHPNEVRVDAPITGIVTVPTKTAPKIVVTHASATGWITVLDANDPGNASSAYSMRGFYLTGPYDSNALDDGDLALHRDGCSCRARTSTRCPRRGTLSLSPSRSTSAAFSLSVSRNPCPFPSRRRGQSRRAFADDRRRHFSSGFPSLTPSFHPLPRPRQRLLHGPFLRSVLGEQRAEQLQRERRVHPLPRGAVVARAGAGRDRRVRGRRKQLRWGAHQRILQDRAALCRRARALRAPLVARTAGAPRRGRRSHEGDPGTERRHEPGEERRLLVRRRRRGRLRAHDPGCAHEPHGRALVVHARRDARGRLLLRTGDGPGRHAGGRVVSRTDDQCVARLSLPQRALRASHGGSAVLSATRRARGRGTCGK
jgi:hypothetical protein